MSAQIEPGKQPPEPLPGYQSILVAVDSSDHSNRGIEEAVELALLWGARVTGVHVYAAKMHDVRFRQMEGGLPDKYRQEQELERQRDVHDDLITRGLSTISDSYLDQVERVCARHALRCARRAPEGKNYRELVKETDRGVYDLLVLGALGLGATPGSRLGSVCERVVRRSSIDTLVIKEPQRSLACGPIVVAVDGSARAYGGLLTALALAGRWSVPVYVVAAFDPYFHYVAFNRIAGVLSEEAGKVFRFKEQEKLHEEIIDAGLAKIYEGHLAVARRMAADYGAAVDTVLLDGKPQDAIQKFVRKVQPSLLVIGKLGVHADPELDIGGNAENLLRSVDCAVLLSQREHRPRVERLAEVTTSWTKEAEQRMQRVPTFVRDMARMAILRYAQVRGHTVITERIVEEATAELMPSHVSRAAEPNVPVGAAAGPVEADWSPEARRLLDAVGDGALRGNLKLRAEKKAKQAASGIVEREHIAPFLDAQTPGTGVRQLQAIAPKGPTTEPGSELHWHAAALARLMRVPMGFMRDAARARIEQYARAQSLPAVSLEVAERELIAARRAMEEAVQGRETGASDTASPATTEKAQCPFSSLGAPRREDESGSSWTQMAEQRLLRIPHEFCRDMTRRAAEAIAGQKGIEVIDDVFVEQVMQTIEAGSAAAAESLAWEESARERIARAPAMVRGMLVREIEAWAKRHGLERVDHAAVNAVKNEWQHRGVFHLDPTDPRSRQP